jgi:hypothetical protein
MITVFVTDWSFTFYLILKTIFMAHKSAKKSSESVKNLGNIIIDFRRLIKGTIREKE